MNIVLAKLHYVTLPIVLCLSSPAVVASNSLLLTPSDQTVDFSVGAVGLELWMDFDEPTLGGGIDLTLNGPLAFAGFTPSVFFLNDADESFSGHSGPEGTADNDYEIHFGDFNGLSGLNMLGTIEVALTGSGTGFVDVAINSTWGDFYHASNFQIQDVTLSGATLNVTAVPVPAALWLFASGLGFIGLRAKRSEEPAKC